MSPFYFAYQLIRHGNIILYFLIIIVIIIKKGLPSLAGILGTFKMFAFVPISYSLAYVIRGNDTYYVHYM